MLKRFILCHGITSLARARRPVQESEKNGPLWLDRERCFGPSSLKWGRSLPRRTAGRAHVLKVSKNIGMSIFIPKAFCHISKYSFRNCRGIAPEVRFGNFQPLSFLQVRISALLCSDYTNVLDDKHFHALAPTPNWLKSPEAPSQWEEAVSMTFLRRRFHREKLAAITQPHPPTSPTHQPFFFIIYFIPHPSVALRV